MPITVNHQAIEQGWLVPDQINSPKTLVLGSFNPFNGNQNVVDYYYGRSSNHFWKSIAVLIGEAETYFCDEDEGLNRKISVMQNRFACLDVIDSIIFNGVIENVVANYVNAKVFSNFLDQNIWHTNTNFAGAGLINLRRDYNQMVIQTLENTNSIRKVIHTMVYNRINVNRVKPLELNLEEDGFRSYVLKIIEICARKNIEFVYDTFSPSGYAVRTGRTNVDDLREWLARNLGL